MLDLLKVIPAFITMAGCSSDITPDTVSAIIAVESSWDQSSQSKFGAYGLMQVTQVAVDDYNRRHGTGITIRDVATEPIINIMIGVDHLCQWRDLDKRGKVIAYFTGRRRYLEMVRGDADYMVGIAEKYYQAVVLKDNNQDKP